MSECRRQCSPRSFLFGREDPQKFALPQARWPLLPGSFIAYRVIIALYQVAVFITLLIKWGTPPLYSQIDVKAKWLIFISNWSFLVLTLYMIWAAFATCYWHMIGKKRSDDTHNNKEDIAMQNSTATETDLIDSESVILIPQSTWYFKINWFLQVIACSAELAVTVLFWAIEFNPTEGTVHFFNLSVHGLGAALVIIDFMLVANPCRLLHVIYPMLYAAVYFLFTYIYFVAGGLNPSGETHIYRGSIDWGTIPLMSLGVSAFAALVGASLIHVFFFLLYLIKLSFAKCCGFCNNSSS